MLRRLTSTLEAMSSDDERLIRGLVRLFAGICVVCGAAFGVVNLILDTPYAASSLMLVAILAPSLVLSSKTPRLAAKVLVWGLTGWTAIAVGRYGLQVLLLSPVFLAPVLAALLISARACIQISLTLVVVFLAVALLETWEVVVPVAIPSRPELWLPAGLMNLAALSTAVAIASWARGRLQRRQLDLLEKLDEERRLASLGEIAGGIAHEFNNLLTVIIANASVLADTDPFKPIDQEALEDIQVAAASAAATTADLLAYARKGQQPNQLLDIAQVLRGRQRILTGLLDDHHTLLISCPPDVGSVEVSPAALDRVLVNLVKNAAEAMPDGGSIHVRAYRLAPASHSEAGDRWIGLEVEDNGPGMTEEVQQRCFEPFFTTHGRALSTGLGLSSVHGELARIGGDIVIDSVPGRGTTFVCRLPRADSIDPVTLTPDRRRLAFLIEDDELVMRLNARVLTREGIDFVAARSGAEAETVFSEHRDDIALVIADVVLGDTTSPTLIERFRAQRPELKVLYISGHTQGELGEIERDPQAGFMSKPFRPAVLLERLAELADRWSLDLFPGQPKDDAALAPERPPSVH